jgi:hypothetical protein
MGGHSFGCAATTAVDESCDRTQNPGPNSYPWKLTGTIFAQEDYKLDSPEQGEAVESLRHTFESLD